MEDFSAPQFVGRYIVVDPRVCHGKPTFRGTRIMVADVLEQVAEGRDWETIVEGWHHSISEEAIAEALQLARQALEFHIRQSTLKEACDGETGLMSFESVMDKTKSVLQDFADNADKIMAELEPGRDSGLLEVMNRLAKRINTVENEADLIAVANIVHNLAIEIPCFPPDDVPPQHFRLENLKPAAHSNGFHHYIENYKASLKDVFNPCFKRIEQAWRDLPSVIPRVVSKGSKEPDWDLIKKLKDDPTWDDFFEEIERERDENLVWADETE